MRCVCPARGGVGLGQGQGISFLGTEAKTKYAATDKGLSGLVEKEGCSSVIVSVFSQNHEVRCQMGSDGTGSGRFEEKG